MFVLLLRLHRHLLATALDAFVGLGLIALVIGAVVGPGSSQQSAPQSSSLQTIANRHSPQVELAFSGLQDPGGLAVDAAGNIYVTDDNNRVLELPAGSTTQVELPFTGLKSPGGWPWMPPAIYMSSTAPTTVECSNCLPGNAMLGQFLSTRRLVDLRSLVVSVQLSNRLGGSELHR
jgi:hypothetical protein